jgi:hypothetical protein
VAAFFNISCFNIYWPLAATIVATIAAFDYLEVPVMGARRRIEGNADDWAAVLVSFAPRIVLFDYLRTCAR